MSNDEAKSLGQQDLDNCVKRVPIASVYRHPSGGQYVVFALTCEEWSGDVVVHYYSMTHKTRWTRRYQNFVAQGQWPDAPSKPRFARERDATDDEMLEACGIKFSPSIAYLEEQNLRLQKDNEILAELVDTERKKAEAERVVASTFRVRYERFVEHVERFLKPHHERMSKAALIYEKALIKIGDLGGEHWATEIVEEAKQALEAADGITKP